jgi:hypothetical protein
MVHNIVSIVMCPRNKYKSLKKLNTKWNVMLYVLYLVVLPSVTSWSYYLYIAIY